MGQQPRTNHSTRSGNRHIHRATEAGDGWGHSAVQQVHVVQRCCMSGWAGWKAGDPASPVTWRVPSSVVLKPGVPILLLFCGPRGLQES